MGQKKITAEDLQNEFNAAGADTDFKAMAQKAISVLADVEGQLTALQADNEEVKGQLEGSLAQVSELGSKLDMQEKTKDLPGKLVSVGGESKLLMGKRFVINKKEYTADEVANSEELLDFLASKKSGALVDPKQATDGLTDKTAA
jgi:capsule polysaccharide export protein KpsE/RkpR